MAEDYISINSIEELKKKLNMNFMNKKFKDREGNKYVVRFVKDTRKLEIFRLHTKSELQKNSSLTKKTFEQNEQSFESETDFEDEEFLESIKQSKSEVKEVESKFEEEKSNPLKFEKFNQTLTKIKAIFTFSKIKAVEEDIEEDFDLNIEETSFKKIEPKKLENEIEIPTTIQEYKFYFAKILKSLGKDKDRINSSIVNLKNSRYFELIGDPSENKNILSNISREFDTEIFIPLETYSAKLKEITSFPKSINHYTMNYNRIQKDFISSLNSTEIKLDYILQWDLLDNLIILSNKYSKMNTEVLNLLNKKVDMRILNSVQQSQFEDAKSGIIFCMNDLNYLRRNLDNFQKKVKENA